MTEIVRLAKSCKTRKEFLLKHPTAYHTAYHAGVLDQVWSAANLQKSRPEPLFTKDEVLTHARQFRTRKEWKAACKTLRPSPYRWAVRRNLYHECVAHMDPTKPDFSNWVRPLKYTNDEIKASAAKYKHKSEWKNSEDNGLYQRALKRGKDFFNECTAHMTPAANPYAGDYVIYAFKFTDQHIYVGLTFKVEDRKAGHLRFGPVCRHIQECPTYEFTILQDKITSPAEAVAAEKKWIDHYRNDPEWTVMNDAPGGSLGSVQAQSTWTVDELVAIAGQFRTRKEWLLGNQAVYKRAKRMGVFEEVCRKAGLPRRVSPRPVTVPPQFVDRFATATVNPAFYTTVLTPCCAPSSDTSATGQPVVG